MKKRKYLKLILTYTTLIVLTCIIVFPIYWMIITSLKFNSEIFIWPPKILPSRINWANYILVLFKSNIPRFFLNSTKVALVSGTMACFFSVLGGYALSRFNFLGKKTIFSGIMMVQIFPIVVLILPFYIFWKNLGLLDTHLSIMIIYIGINVPVGTWLLTGFFEGIPKELEEAAMIDGCSRMGALFRVIFPFMKAPIFSVFLFLFIAIWNEYMVAYTFISEESMKTMSIGLISFKGQYTANWGAIMAAATIGIIPIVIIFSIFQKYFIKGLAEGAIKG